MAQHRLLDRLIRGRVWIGIVAFALIGIVTLQLGLLKLNGGIGRALEREGKLQTENAAISIENSEMASATRVESQASAQGMVFEPNGTLRFLAARAGADVGQAVAALSASLRSPGGESGETVSTSREQSASGEGTTASGGEAASSGSSEHGTSGGASSSGGGEAGGGESTAGSESPTRSETSSGSETSASAGTSGGEAHTTHTNESSSGAEAEASSASATGASGATGG